MKMDFVLSTTTEYAMKLALLDVLQKAEKNVFDEFIVVAPETKTLYVERFLLDNSKNKAFSNIYIYSFNRLLKKLQKKNIYPLSKEAGVMIVRNLIMALSEDLVCYKKTAGTVCSISLIFIGAFLTALKLYQPLGKFAGAGSIVPITGFSNSVVSPAIEYKSEGLMLGIGANMFKVAGPVLVYGIGSSVILGLIYYIINLFI